jgi:transcriptional regulator with XRE-family HTH domain
MTSGKQIFDELVRRGLTLSQLAKASGVPRHKLQQIVASAGPPDEVAAKRIGSAFAKLDDPRIK